MKMLLLGALLGATVMTAPATATVVSFKYSANDGGFGFFGSNSIEGSGTFTTFKDDGTFGLNGLKDFTASGYSGGFVGGGFTLGLKDLAKFSVTLVNGAVSSVSLRTTTFFTDNYFLGFADFGLEPSSNQLSVSGLGTSNLTALRDNVELGGTFSVANRIGQPVPGGPGSGGPTPVAVPEPATWAMMIGGLGLTGGMLRRRGGRKPVLATA